MLPKSVVEAICAPLVALKRPPMVEEPVERKLVVEAPPLSVRLRPEMRPVLLTVKSVVVAPDELVEAMAKSTVASDEDAA